ncbi:MAG: ABC transporter permease [Pedosphaera sp.]|nr:ABC transporter permease [Pedosphaera sp.]
MMGQNTGTQSGFFREAGRLALLFGEIVRSLFTQRHSWHDFVCQLYFIGNRSQSVVLVTGTFTGMVLCAQTFFQFHKVKMDSASLSIVSVAMASELGPVLAGLMVAGRVGAAMTAELGTMRVTEQIDALRTLATHPVDYLVVPRFLATVVALPLLTVEAVAIGIVAGWFVAVGVLGVDPAYSIKHMLHFTETAHLLMGLLKSFVFGGIIALIGCHKGLTCGDGAEGVGRATNDAVVHACVGILVTNFFLTMFLRSLLYPQ